VDDILGKEKDQLLADIFKEPLTDKDAIAFRQRVFEDLIDERAYTIVRGFVESIKEVSRLLSLEAEVYEEFKYGLHIDAALTYVNALEATLNLVRGLNVKSEGIASFISYLEGLVQGKEFQALKGLAYEAKAARDKIKVRVSVDGNRVRVTGDGGEDLSSRVEQLFSRFKGQQVRQIRFTGSREQTTHVHAMILRGIYTIFKEEFNVMRRLRDEFPNILDEGVKNFAKEFEFYIKYIEYMRDIESKGYKFSIPQFTEDGSIHVKGFYSMLLARRGTAVTNDIHASGDRRVFIITGVNGGGKTTFAITFGQLAFLASIGVPVPAEEARVPLFSNIITAFPVEEDRLESLSRLEEDIVRAVNILKAADSRTLVIVNELFSTTTSDEGFELARRFVSEIASRGSYLIYVTFITKIATLENVISLVAQVQDGRPTFKIVEGGPPSSYMAVQIAARHRLLYEDVRGHVGR
jgi:DNA mismatch repair ATPase MutS